MFSALKRLVNNENTNKDISTNQTPSSTLNQSNLSSNQSASQVIQNGMQSISQTLQKKFSKGVTYNMKIVIRGDCNTGKTCLWLRLQGKPFKETYEPSEQINVANIHWNYKLNETDVVKVEIWDVIDKCKKKNATQGASSGSGSSLSKLKTTNAEKKLLSEHLSQIEASLDAEFIDVYKNANGCILIYDITKQWTWDYVERELPKIPSHIPVLIIGNHKDMHNHRNITEMKCKYFIENLNRGSLQSTVRYAETSMRNGFGLSYLYKFLNIPFLQLQRETLMQQLETNAKETDIANEELELMETNNDKDYDAFIDNLNDKRRSQSEKLAADALKNAKTIDQAKQAAIEKEEAEKAAAAIAAANASDGKKIINNLMQKITPILSNNSPSAQPTKTPTNPASQKVTPQSTPKNVKPNVLEQILPEAIDEFNSFLNESKSPIKPATTPQTLQIVENDDDDDEDDLANGNPMVAGYNETVDLSSLSSNSDNERKKSKSENKKIQIAVKNYSGESSEDESEKRNNETMKNSIKSTENDFVLINDGLNGHNDAKHSALTEKSHKQPEIKLTNDDFEFLEKLGNNLNQNLTITTGSSSLNSSRRDSSVASSLNKQKSTETTKKKKKKSTKNDDTLNDGDEENVKKKKHKKKDKEEKKSSKKSSKKQHKLTNDTNEEDDDEQDDNKVHIKADYDYEQI